MPLEAASMETAQPFERIKLALVGREKSGKTHCAGTARTPILHIDWDGRKEVLAGRKDIYSVTLTDVKIPGKQPDAFALAMDMQTQLEQSLDLSQIVLRDAEGKYVRIFPTAPVGTLVKTIVDDSVQRMAKAAMAYNMYSNPKLRREIKISGREIHFPGGFDAWSSEMAMVEELVCRRFGLGNGTVDVVATFHETDEETPDSSNETPRYTGRKTIYPLRYTRLLGLFNEVWRLELVAPISGDLNRHVPKLQTAADYKFVAATALNVDQFEEPDIAKLIAKHVARTVQVQPLQATTAPTLP